MNKIVLSVLIVALAIAGCKKDSQSAIVGKWSLIKLDFKLYDYGGKGEVIEDTTFANTNPTGYIEFNTDGSGYSTFGGTTTTDPNSAPQQTGAFNYKLSGNVLTFNNQATPGASETVSFNGKEMLISNKLFLPGNPSAVVSETVNYYTK
ncbi:lipocalin family protein [Mucilaginibacter sp. dw_454]|uniref:lipocalin family protein n=1 Tax=Mucilaginibacter sp. dw_454 TaxID=2720079 RepID=UPI001BD68C3A|nr:lipocalin family protein [Mucilaginibacter sp. dw_454]